MDAQLFKDQWFLALGRSLRAFIQALTNHKIQFLEMVRETRTMANLSYLTCLGVIPNRFRNDTLKC